MENEEKEFSYWGLFILGPYYMAYRRYLKEAIIVQVISGLLIELMVERLIAPSNPETVTILGAVMEFPMGLFIALKWEDYLNWNRKTGPIRLNWWVCAGLVIGLSLLMDQGFEFLRHK